MPSCVRFYATKQTALYWNLMTLTLSDDLYTHFMLMTDDVYTACYYM
jgi:hypothetical protein